MSQVVLYHAGCTDGFCSAWIAHKVMPDAQFIAVNYGQPVPEFAAGSEVWILDFSYSRQQMLEILDAAKFTTVLDHHETAAKELEGLVYDGKLEASNALIVFDMNKSGGRLAWEHFFPGKPAPWLVDYTEDRDLWRWLLPESRAINAALRSYPMQFEVWDSLSNGQSFIAEGNAILRSEKQIIDNHVGHATEQDIAGYKVLCVNATVLISEIAGELANGKPFGACWFQRSDGKKVFSLRSDENGLDVSIIAKNNGGGGHRHAAGFEV